MGVGLRVRDGRSFAFRSLGAGGCEGLLELFPVAGEVLRFYGRHDPC